MKPCKNHILALFGLIIGFTLTLPNQMTAQTFAALRSFTATAGPFPSTNSDGAFPKANCILSGNTLYGVASEGGSLGWGTVFAVKADGNDFTNLHSFTGNDDGANPCGGLILSGNTLYGTTQYGGNSSGYQGNGTVFKVNTDGTGFTNLHTFTALSDFPSYTNSDGARPVAGLILSGNTLYGTAPGGGSSGNGAVFAVNTEGAGFTNLHSFTAGSDPFPTYPNVTNSDGAFPNAGLVLSGNTLYGTTFSGGSDGVGAIFRVHTDGTGFTNLHSFTALSVPPSTNNEGARPVAGLILSGNTLYGTASAGGVSGNGTVFAFTTDGAGFTNLHNFAPTIGGYPSINSEGAHPVAGLILSGNTLYGTASAGGSSGNGTVFAVNADTTGFTTLHSFTALNSNTNGDGASPSARLILAGNILYGTTRAGGGSGNGTVFNLSFAPKLTIVQAGTNVVLTWPTNIAGFGYGEYNLQATTNLVSPTVWTTVSPAPVVVNGQYTVTNPVSGTQPFYRLSQ